MIWKRLWISSHLKWNNNSMNTIYLVLLFYYQFLALNLLGTKAKEYIVWKSLCADLKLAAIKLIDDKRSVSLDNLPSVYLHMSFITVSLVCLCMYYIDKSVTNQTSAAAAFQNLNLRPVEMKIYFLKSWFVISHTDNYTYISNNECFTKLSITVQVK